MSDIQQVSVGGVTYNVAQAPAMNQKKLMLLIAGRVAYVSARSEDPIDVKLLFGSLVGLDEKTFDEIASLVLPTVREHGEPDQIVDVKSFQGEMMNYFKLVAEAIKVNLNDFFTYWDTVNEENRTKKAQKPNR